MSAISQLLTDHIDIWTAADTVKKSGRGRSSGNAASVYGIRKLRELILELAVRGKLVPQDANDEPASELLKRIQAEKAKLIAEGKIKKDKPLAAITDEEKPFVLPFGWEWVRLGSVIDYVNGFAFSSKDFADNGFGVVKIGDIQQGCLEPAYMSRVSADIIMGLDERLKVETGDLVIAMSGATTGKLGFNETEEVFYLNQRVGKIVPFIISKRFLYFDLTTKIAENLKISFGSAIPNLSTEQINAIVTGLPPLAEQHRIVAKVDELMALCDQLETQHTNAAEAHEKLVNHLLGTLTHTSVRGEPVEPHPSTSPLALSEVEGPGRTEFDTNWQRIAAHFDTLFTTEASIDALKQTLLQLAVMGKLVPQDPNDEPASELLKRILAEKAKLVAEGKIKKDKPLPLITDEEIPFELPQGWEWARMIDCAKQITDGEHLTPQRTPDFTKIPLVTAKNVRDGNMDYTNTDYVDCDVATKCWNRCKPEHNDILIVSVGATIGRLTIIDDLRDMVIVRSVTLVKPLLINIPYLALGLRSPYLQTRIWSGVKQNAQPCLYLSVSNSLPIPVPPLFEQHRIVAKIDELMTLCDQLKSRITAASQLQQKLANVLIEQAVA